VVRLYAGHLMTSLEMAGILVSLLKVTGRSDWLDWLDRPTAAPAWPVSLLSGNLTLQKSSRFTCLRAGTKDTPLIWNNEGSLQIRIRLFKKIYLYHFENLY
jgi:hypothetical protein